MRNKQYYDMYMDFGTLRDNKIYPCDIDLYYRFRDGFIVIGEAKLKGHHLMGMQEHVLTNLIDNHKQGGVLLEIEHNKRIQDGENHVDIAECNVSREYYEGKWHTHDIPDNVLERLIELKKLHD